MIYIRASNIELMREADDILNIAIQLPHITNDEEQKLILRLMDKAAYLRHELRNREVFQSMHKVTHAIMRLENLIITYMERED